jgi:hypothetical protein
VVASLYRLIGYLSCPQLSKYLANNPYSKISARVFQNK